MVSAFFLNLCCYWSSRLCTLYLGASLRDAVRNKPYSPLLPFTSSSSSTCTIVKPEALASVLVLCHVHI